MLWIDGGHFCAGIVLDADGRVSAGELDTAPILRWTRHWTARRLRHYGARRGWLFVETK